MSNIITRFGPSPTGAFHLGSARTAIFNWLFAKHHKGKFILRIDDTDQSRNNANAIKPIFDGLEWLGLNWDEGPYYQSERTEHYQAALDQLVSWEYAYQDEGAYRLKISDKIKKMTTDDLVRGKTTWQIEGYKDPVIVRADGKFLYNFATVVDDLLMGITHVFRGEEHLSNTPIQLLIYDALGQQPPQFGHLPFVCAPNSRKKLSKRDMAQFMTDDVKRSLNEIGYNYEDIPENLNPATLEFYRELGYLPEAMFNYLVRLGWALDGETEKFSIQQAIDAFDVDKIIDSPASFDPKKLLWLQSWYMNELDREEKVNLVRPYLRRAGIPDKDIPTRLLRHVVIAADHRLKLLSDIISLGACFFEKPRYDHELFQKVICKEGAVEILQKFSSIVDDIGFFSSSGIERAVNNFIEENGIRIVDFVHPLRIALTGRSTGMGLYDSMSILGREETKVRIQEAIDYGETLSLIARGNL